MKMLSNLLCDSNLEVQNNLLELMKQNRDIYYFFSYIKDRMHVASDNLIREMHNKLKQRQLAIDSSKFYKDPRIESMYNKFQQPFYLPSQSNTGQGMFNLESEVIRLTH